MNLGALLLGSGMARQAARRLAGRQARVNAAVNAESNGQPSPKPQPVKPKKRKPPQSFFRSFGL